MGSERPSDAGTRARGLVVEGLFVSPGGTPVLTGVDLRVDEGEIVAVLGVSGSGKTTLLRAVAGLEIVDTGRVIWNGVDVTDVAPHRRRFGLMFQDHALFPHRDVTANVEFGLRMRGVARRVRTRRVTDVLEMLDVAHLAHRSVADLSGGEAQRVALGRALAPEPGLLLLDEPLSSLDRPLRDRLLGELREVLHRVGQTAMYVTHDFDEAAAIADRVAVLRGGRIVRTAGPAALRDDPGDAATARMVGHPNVVRAVGEGGRLVTDWGPVEGWWGPEGDLEVVVATDAVQVTRDGEGDALVTRVAVHGDGYRAIVRRDGHEIVAAVASPALEGERVNVTIDGDGVRLLDAQ